MRAFVVWLGGLFTGLAGGVIALVVLVFAANGLHALQFRFFGDVFTGPGVVVMRGGDRRVELRCRDACDAVLEEANKP